MNFINPIHCPSIGNIKPATRLFEGPQNCVPSLCVYGLISTCKHGLSSQSQWCASLLAGATAAPVAFHFRRSSLIDTISNRSLEWMNMARSNFAAGALRAKMLKRHCPAGRLASSLGENQANCQGGSAPLAGESHPITYNGKSAGCCVKKIQLCSIFHCFLTIAYYQHSGACQIFHTLAL